MSSLAKMALPVLKPAMPYLARLPTSLLTLVPSAAFHFTSHPSPNPWTYFLDPLTHPLHAPMLFTAFMIPLFYFMGLISGNVGWVDRSWPFYTPLCSYMILLWAFLNPSAGVYAHNLPRLVLMMTLQLIWSTRLFGHALKRDFYDLTSEDYRYTQFKKLVPNWLFQLVHIFVIALAQPLLLFALALPFHAVLVHPPSELQSGAMALPYSAIERYLPARFQTAPGSTPVLHLGDVALTLVALTILYIEAKADRQMYAYQTSKHSSNGETTVSQPRHSTRIGPKPAPFPKSHHPGFITSGLFAWTRHPNFAAEQLFWVSQALFVVVAGNSSQVTRSGWLVGSIFGPCFCLSLLFCASTFLTEWITERKYPLYHSYRRLVGQFLPQETFLCWLWSTVTGSSAEHRRALKR
ncbi:hypothetical protein BD324DRAFT_611831 [Kockovaella imperatae]|uniref:Steroid 5-alpha reductase C-terminal domain-containing protein n=1 Tax=Kockovaella imperatae TaxID=4999 RepID=A0A1Y1URP0_9TREE|nr:hypothetical protein BD324DRAFT_611831 [Kockovaella imperatae]ORX40710.1 hypothetical protein BD324DRAFT_611831 [Kockovaella imperatae]